MSEDLEHSNYVDDNEGSDGGHDIRHAVLLVVDTVAAEDSSLFPPTHYNDDAVASMQGHDGAEEARDAIPVAAPEALFSSHVMEGALDDHARYSESTAAPAAIAQFFGSRRAQNFLDCKGVPYIMIDANRDVSKGADLQDQEFIEEWLQHNLLAKDADGAVSRFCIPQVLIDGVAIGKDTDLQDLEEDGDLDWILARTECPSCFAERPPYAESCSVCHVQFLELVPEDLIQNRRVQRYCRGLPFVDELPQPLRSQNYHDIVNAAALLHDDAQGQTVTYETLFGEPPPADG